MKCKTPDCQSEAAPHRRYCKCCVQHKYRDRYPIKYIFAALKTNAKRREKYFSLTLDEFTQFCDMTGYDKLRGITAASLTIDRINPLLGYHKDNIRAITLRHNVQLRHGVEIDPEFMLISYVPF